MNRNASKNASFCFLIKLIPKNASFYFVINNASSASFCFSLSVHWLRKMLLFTAILFYSLKMLFWLRSFFVLLKMLLFASNIFLQLKMPLFASSKKYYLLLSASWEFQNLTFRSVLAGIRAMTSWHFRTGSFANLGFFKFLSNGAGG